jgi:hypothetical protein
MPKKRKTLPNDFEARLAKQPLPALKAIFDTCELDARGGFAKQTALAFDCPAALTRWLVEQGASLDAIDTWGNTPLHTRARSRTGSITELLKLGADVNAMASLGTPLHAAADAKHLQHTKALLKAGATVDARNRQGLTPLEAMLQRSSNVDLEHLPPMVKTLLDAGAAPSPAAKDFVTKLGATFEFHRKGFNPALRSRAEAGLAVLYRALDVTPVKARVEHDGRAPIEVPPGPWQRQHAALWERLVPSSGPAKTLQGEVIRITGRVSGEWHRNGGANWDRDFGLMVRALATHLRAGTPLGDRQLASLDDVIAGLARRGGEGHERLAELAVAWVKRNPTPLTLPRPAYRR